MDEARQAINSNDYVQKLAGMPKLTNEQRQRLNIQIKEFNEALQKRNGKSERLEYNLEIPR
jgi:hypothetical protein